MSNESLHALLVWHRALNLNDESSKFIRSCLVNFNISCSQLFQDVFVAEILGWKREGYFVEVGAGDGLNISNTFMFEKHFGWNGILCEANTHWHTRLRANRKAIIDTRCVWSLSNANISFAMSEQDGEYATIDLFRANDMHAERRANFSSQEVTTISLVDLLEECGAPREIDYLSIDTEGSEFDIIRDFDFDKYKIKVLTIEHNFNELQRGRILRLLTEKGFERKFVNLSNFDDWYVKK